MGDSGCGLLEQEMENVWNLITNTSNECERRKNALSLWLWVSELVSVYQNNLIIIIIIIII